MTASHAAASASAPTAAQAAVSVASVFTVAGYEGMRVIVPRALWAYG
jgi:hypothetical protein